jgi:single-strand DNA-binding protein
MKSVNKVILLGNITRDAELKATNGGHNVCTFGIATNHTWKTADGQKNSQPEYTNVVAWGGLADLCAQHAKKGKPVYVEGYLKTRSWENEHGVKMFRTEVVLDNFILIGPKEAFAANVTDADMQSTDESFEDTSVPMADLGFDDALPGGDPMNARL